MFLNWNNSDLKVWMFILFRYLDLVTFIAENVLHKILHKDTYLKKVSNWLYLLNDDTLFSRFLNFQFFPLLKLSITYRGLSQWIPLAESVWGSVYSLLSPLMPLPRLMLLSYHATCAHPSLPTPSLFVRNMAHNIRLKVYNGNLVIMVL